VIVDATTPRLPNGSDIVPQRLPAVGFHTLTRHSRQGHSTRRSHLHGGRTVGFGLPSGFSEGQSTCSSALANVDERVFATYHSLNAKGPRATIKVHARPALGEIGGRSPVSVGLGRWIQALRTLAPNRPVDLLLTSDSPTA